MIKTGVLLAFALQGASPAASDEVEREIVVLGTKMKAWKAGATRTRCVTLTSSGDKAIDAIGCSVMKTCVAQFGPQLKAARKIRRTPEGKASYTAQYREFETCVMLRRDTLIAELAELAERRFQARQGTNNASN